jgi:hypothetical protein
MEDKKVFRVFITSESALFADVEAADAADACAKVVAGLADISITPIEVGLTDADVLPIEDPSRNLSYKIEKAIEIDRGMAQLQ